MNREVRVIGAEGKQLGVMQTHIAIRIAQEKGLDLVEINPKTDPPVCKIIDYGRFKYEEARKKRASKKKQSVVVIKEVKLRPKTDKHDLAVKVRMIMRFLADGNKAKLVIIFRGREIVHPETGKSILLKVLTELGDYAVVEQMPTMEGRRMTMMVAPKPGVTIPVPKKKGDKGDKTEDAQGVEEDLDDELEAANEEAEAAGEESSGDEAKPGSTPPA